MPLDISLDIANVVTAGMNTIVTPDTTPGIDSGSTTRAITLMLFAPRVLRRLDHALRSSLFKHGVDGQYHEGQEVVHHAQQHRALRAYHLLLAAGRNTPAT